MPLEYLQRHFLRCLAERFDRNYCKTLSRGWHPVHPSGRLFSRWQSEDDRVNAVKEWAEPVAKKIINEGYFRIGNHYCIRVDILELYYNEEAEGGLKDPIMYHTNDRIPKHLKDAGIYDLP